MFMRSLPDVPSAPLSVQDTVAEDEILCSAMTFPAQRFPMIDKVVNMDVKAGRITVSRTFNPATDLWIGDHKPFKFMQHPLISAIMAVETFLETAVLLYPHLRPRGVRNVQFLDIIECPPETDRSCEISCVTESMREDEIVCNVEFSTRETSSGRIPEKPVLKYRAQVVLGGSSGKSGDLPGFPVLLAELDGRPMENPEVREWYTDRSDMRDRYKVMERLDGTGPQSVRGLTVYKEASDFRHPRLIKLCVFALSARSIAADGEFLHSYEGYIRGALHDPLWNRRDVIYPQMHRRRGTDARSPYREPGRTRHHLECAGSR